MRPSINIHADRVVREGAAERLYVAWTPVLQPDDPEELHARLSDRPYGPGFDGLRLCRLVDGVWHDSGEAPSLADASWHPDLGDALNGSISIARRVIAAIGHCRGVTVLLEGDGDADGGYTLRSVAMFDKERDPETGMSRGFVDDQTLDAIPYVRHVERSGVFAATLFGIAAEDDGSGPDSNFTMIVEPGRTEITCGPEDKTGISFRSELVDGEWRHRTHVQAFERDDGVIEAMKRAIDPARRLAACLEDVGKASRLLRSPTLVVDGILEPDEGRVTTRFSILPGTLSADGR